MKDRYSIEIREHTPGVVFVTVFGDFDQIGLLCAIKSEIESIHHATALRTLVIKLQDSASVPSLLISYMKKLSVHGVQARLEISNRSLHGYMKRNLHGSYFWGDGVRTSSGGLVELALAS